MNYEIFDKFIIGCNCVLCVMDNLVKLFSKLIIDDNDKVENDVSMVVEMFKKMNVNCNDNDSSVGDLIDGINKIKIVGDECVMDMNDGNIIKVKIFVNCCVEGRIDDGYGRNVECF